jgi:hypothetical protein
MTQGHNNSQCLLEERERGANALPGLGGTEIMVPFQALQMVGHIVILDVVAD